MEVTFESTINGVIEEITGNIDTAVIQETLDVQPDELREGECMAINEGCGCDERDEAVPEGVILAKKGILRDIL